MSMQSVIQPSPSVDVVLDVSAGGLTFLNANLTTTTASSLSSGRSQETAPIQLSHDITHSLITASGESMVTNDYLKPAQAREMVESGRAQVDADIQGGAWGAADAPPQLPPTVITHNVEAEGSARTDFHRNHMLCFKVKKRRTLQKKSAEQSGIDLASVQGEQRDAVATEVVCN